jgi:hypothetical protein
MAKKVARMAKKAKNTGFCKKKAIITCHFYLKILIVEVLI